MLVYDKWNKEHKKWINILISRVYNEMVEL